MTTQTIEITDLTDDQVQVMFRHLCSVSRGQWLPFTAMDIKQAYAIAVVGTTPPHVRHMEPEPYTAVTFVASLTTAQREFLQSILKEVDAGREVGQ